MMTMWHLRDVEDLTELKTEQASDNGLMNKASYGEWYMMTIQALEPPVLAYHNGPAYSPICSRPKWLRSTASLPKLHDRLRQRVDLNDQISFHKWELRPDF